MRRRVLTIGVALAIALTVQPNARNAYGAAGWELHFDVYYSCIVSPPMAGNLEGQWDRDCQGNVTGWGTQPYTNCHDTQVTYGAYCGDQP
jgi:hypothetical protein